MKDKIDLIEGKGKLFTILIGVLLVISLFAITLKKDENIDKEKETDAIKFKEQYEQYNGVKNSYGYLYPKVTIDSDNPFIFVDEKETVKLLENGTGLIYIGYSKCPWCRNAVNVLNYVNADKIYYLDSEEIRDTYEVVNGVVTKTKDASQEYYKILELLNDILLDYEITKDGVKYQVGEKRLYVPMVVGVKEGKIVGYHIDTVSLEEGQTAFDLLTKKQQNELKLIYDNINASVNGDVCDINSETGC